MIAAALAISGAILWAAGAAAPGIAPMRLGLIIPAVSRFAVGRKINDQRK
ncbi:hypothetical protein O2W18_00445 [Modestobacter sp. VKM Ac-2983]|nr:hypothetical protein [Modestobacter sp. VKM Ac-2983]MCZ2803569.1 hypothetical protein [Modestobacter sp. VKM Ac-2983]